MATLAMLLLLFAFPLFGIYCFFFIGWLDLKPLKVGTPWLNLAAMASELCDDAATHPDLANPPSLGLCLNRFLGHYLLLLCLQLLQLIHELLYLELNLLQLILPTTGSIGCSRVTIEQGFVVCKSSSRASI